MAIFSKTKKAAPKKAVVKKEVAVRGEASREIGNYSPSVLIRPRVTEKAAFLSEKSVYTFDVEAGATKGSVAKAVQSLYKVTPISVHIMNVPSKKMFSRGKRGSTKAGRKAYVALKAGDKIEFV